MRGTLTAEAGSALIVPTEAVLPEKNGYTLFTVRNGHAVRHLVHVGLETDTEVQVEGRGVAAGESAVLAGNYELQPGMAVSPQASR
jgi:membrane fusion protein (multidrug efflux system)